VCAQCFWFLTNLHPQNGGLKEQSPMGLGIIWRDHLVGCDVSCAGAYKHLVYVATPRQLDHGLVYQRKPTIPSQKTISYRCCSYPTRRDELLMCRRLVVSRGEEGRDGTVTAGVRLTNQRATNTFLNCVPQTFSSFSLIQCNIV